MKKLLFLALIALLCLSISACDSGENDIDTTAAETEAATVAIEETSAPQEETTAIEVTEAETTAEESTVEETTIEETTNEGTTPPEEIIITPNDSPRYSFYAIRDTDLDGEYPMEDFYNLTYTDIPYTELMDKEELKLILNDLITDSVNEGVEGEKNYIKEDSLKIYTYFDYLWKTKDGHIGIICEVYCSILGPNWTNFSEYILLIDNHSQGSYGIEINNDKFDIPDDRYEFYNYESMYMTTIQLGEKFEGGRWSETEYLPSNYFDYTIMWKLIHEHLNEYITYGKNIRIVELRPESNNLYITEDGKYVSVYYVHLMYEEHDGHLTICGGYITVVDNYLKLE